MPIYQRIRQHLEENGITQTWLAGKVDMKRSKMSMKMTGRRDFSIEEVQRICGVLNISFDSLLDSLPAAYVKPNAQEPQPQGAAALEKKLQEHVEMLLEHSMRVHDCNELRNLTDAISVTLDLLNRLKAEEVSLKGDHSYYDYPPYTLL